MFLFSYLLEGCFLSLGSGNQATGWLIGIVRVIRHTGRFFLSLFRKHESSGRFLWTGLFFYSSISVMQRPNTAGEWMKMKRETRLYGVGRRVQYFSMTFSTFPMTWRIAKYCDQIRCGIPHTVMGIPIDDTRVYASFSTFPWSDQSEHFVTL